MIEHFKEIFLQAATTIKRTRIKTTTSAMIAITYVADLHGHSTVEALTELLIVTVE